MTLTELLVRTLELGERIPEGAEVRFEWGHLPRGEAGLALVLGATFAAALTVWLYRREGRAGALRKGSLATLRLLALAALAVVLLEPRLAVDMTRTVPGRTVVLWDTSLSMSLADRYAEDDRREALAAAAGLAAADDVAALTRHELAWRIVSRAKLLEGLAENNQLLVYGFADQAAAVGSTPAALARDDLAPGGTATDLAGAVRAALSDAGGVRLAAVVAISDGRLTRGEGAQGVVAPLLAREVPLFALAIGDPVPPKNVEVVELEAEPRAMLGDPLVIEGSVRAQGLAGETVDAVLTVTRQDSTGAPAGPPVEVESQRVRIEADGEPVRLTFRYEANEVGDYVFELRVPPVSDEPVVEDNARVAPVKVTEDQARVLLVAGGPSFEYHFLKTRLTREKGAVLSVWLQSAHDRYPQGGNERLQALPRTFEELREFDAVVLVDPDPEGFEGGLAEALKRFVQDHQGGLLYVPGPKHAVSFLSRPDLDPLRALLPIVPAGALDAGGRGATERWPLRATPDGVLHPATRLAGDTDACARAWSRLPGPFFSFPVQRVKHGGVVLVRHQVAAEVGAREGRPLIVTHFFQGGPVVFAGSDESWRWRSVAPRAYDRYWVGLLRFLVQGRLAGGRKRVELLADRQVYALGEPVHVRAQAFDTAYRPLEVPRLTGRARVGGEERDVVFEPTAGRPGWYDATLVPPGLGVVEVALRLPDDDPGSRPETLELTVRRADRELTEPQLDEALLRAVAEGTGGAVVSPGDLSALAARIPTRSEEVVVAGTPIPLWDRWGTLALVAALLGLEWLLRKRSRMV